MFSNDSVQETLRNHNFLNAVQNEDLQRVQELLNGDPRPDINTSIQIGRTPLMIAAERGNLALVEYLLANDANIEAQDLQGATALLLAVHEAQHEVANYLLEQGANVNARMHDRNTPLMIAAAMGYLNMVDLLIRNDADVNAMGQQRYTALMMAANCGHLEVVNRLFQGVRIDQFSTIHDIHIKLPSAYAAANAGLQNASSEEERTRYQAILRLIEDKIATQPIPPNTQPSATPRWLRILASIAVGVLTLGIYPAVQLGRTIYRHYFNKNKGNQNHSGSAPAETEMSEIDQVFNDNRFSFFQRFRSLHTHNLFFGKIKLITVDDDEELQVAPLRSVKNRV